MSFSDGFYFGLGATLAVLFVIGVLSLVASNKVDDTDLSKDERSGMRLFTDYKTGLQYVGGPKGGITPRLDSEGRHIAISETPK